VLISDWDTAAAGEVAAGLADAGAKGAAGGGYTAR
jgi:hypothetical protein